MKRTTLFLTAILIGFTLTAQPPDGGPHKRHRRPEPPKVEQMVSNLSAIQKKRLETITADCQQQVDKLETELNTVRQKIRTLMDQPGDQSDKLFPLIDRESQLQAQIAKTMYTVRQQIDHVLTDEQLAEFRSRLKADHKQRMSKQRPAKRLDGTQKQSRKPRS